MVRFGKVRYSIRGAQEFFDYINNNKDHRYNGLHLDFITKDNKTKTLQFNKIKVGDVMFTDWTGDGNIEHTMIVTEKRSNSYCGIRVTYQNDDRLCDINKINTVFYDYMLSPKTLFNKFSKISILKFARKMSFFSIPSRSTS